MTERTRWTGVARGLALLVLSAGGSACSDAPQGAAGPRDHDDRPNVLLFLTDDQSWLHTGASGCAWIETPAFDRLAAEGVLFTRAHADSPKCTPARSALLTGQSPWRLADGGWFGRTLPARFDVFPQLLEQAGYAIGWTGKGWGPGDLLAGGWTVRHPLGRVHNGRRVDPSADGRALRSFDYAGNLEEFLAERPAGQPFFFWCGTVEPHRPYVAGSGRAAGKRLADVAVPPHLPDGEELRSDLLDYALAVEAQDAHLARVLAVLEEAGELEDTLVVFASDNGIAFPRCKGNLYDGGTRVPLAVRWPVRAAAGRVVDEPVLLSDLAPTILEAAGASVPAAMTGRSLLQLADANGPGRLEPARDGIVTSVESEYPMRALRTREHLLVRNLAPEQLPPQGPQLLVQPAESEELERAMQLAFAPRPAVELYDLAADPWQLEDLSGEPGRTELVAELRARLDEHLVRTGDPRALGDGSLPELVETDPDNWTASAFGVGPTYPPPTAWLDQRSAGTALSDRTNELANGVMALLRSPSRSPDAVRRLDQLIGATLRSVFREGYVPRAESIVTRCWWRLRDAGQDARAERLLAELGAHLRGLGAVEIEGGGPAAALAAASAWVAPAPPGRPREVQAELLLAAAAVALEAGDAAAASAWLESIDCGPPGCGEPFEARRVALLAALESGTPGR